MLTVFWDSTSCTVISVFWRMLTEPDNAYAHWLSSACLTCDSGLWGLEKNLNFLRCIYVFDLVLKYGSDIIGGNWLQHLFYFLILMGIIASIVAVSFFSNYVSGMFQFLDWSFLVLLFDGNVFNWIPKVIWPRLGYFWKLFSDKASYRRLHICLDWDLHEFFKCFFLKTWNFFYI